MSQDMDTIMNGLETFFQPLGLEVHPFQIGWYNDAVSEQFKLKFKPDTIAFVMISTPSMFETAFIPYLKKTVGENGTEVRPTSRDPLDSCMRYYFEEAAARIPSNVEIIQDFEILPNKRPKILVQTAAHVAGAAYYYQKSDVVAQPSKTTSETQDKEVEIPGSQTEAFSESEPNCDTEIDNYDNTISSSNRDKANIVTSHTCVCADPWKGDKKIYGVCIHPKYGGWFAIRGVIIVTDLRADIQRRPPVDCVKTKESRIELLNRFNGNWQDWTFRDVIPVSEKYSDLQKKYFATAPKDRHSLLSELGLMVSIDHSDSRIHDVR